jgi:hypothetical protein
MRKIVWQIIGAIFGALNVAIPLALDAQGLYPNWPWQYHAMVGFIAFAAFVVWMLYDKIKENERLRDSKPSITVEPIKERSDTYLLKVTNNGELATFEAQIQLSDEDPCVFHLSGKPHYRACWDNVEKCQAKIPKGHSASIKLAELYSSPPHFTPLTWRLFYCDNNNAENYATTSCYFPGSYYPHEDGSQTPAIPGYEYKLHVIISSSPSLREGVFKQDYIISYQRGFEQSIPDKVDSKSE